MQLDWFNGIYPTLWHLTGLSMFGDTFKQCVKSFYSDISAAQCVGFGCKDRTPKDWLNFWLSVLRIYKSCFFFLKSTDLDVVCYNRDIPKVKGSINLIHDIQWCWLVVMKGKYLHQHNMTLSVYMAKQLTRNSELFLGTCTALKFIESLELEVVLAKECSWILIWNVNFFHFTWHSNDSPETLWWLISLFY